MQQCPNQLAALLIKFHFIRLSGDISSIPREAYHFVGGLKDIPKADDKLQQGSTTGRLLIHCIFDTSLQVILLDGNEQHLQCEVVDRCRSLFD